MRSTSTATKRLYSLDGRGQRSKPSLALGMLASLSSHHGAYYGDRGWDYPCWISDVEGGNAFHHEAWSSRSCMSHPTGV